MMAESLPSRAEISDIHNLLEMGATGLVLAAEAAIGKQPIQSVQVINHMQKIVKMKKLGLLEKLPEVDLSRGGRAIDSCQLKARQRNA